MDRNTIVRWIIISGLIFAFWKWGMPMFSGKQDSLQASKLSAETYVNGPGFAPDPIDTSAPSNVMVPGSADAPPPAVEICKIKGNRFDAEMTSHGAGLTHFYLRDKQYAGTDGFDMSTTPDIERWHSLRTQFRGAERDQATGTDQVKYDRVNWKLDRLPNESGCTFTYADEGVRIVKTVTPTERPFEVNVATTVTNLAAAPKQHRFSIEGFAFRRNAEVKGKLGRVSPFQSELVCAREGDVTRKQKDDFKEGWFEQPLVDRFVAISNYYFVEALIPTLAEPGEKPECRVLAEDWITEGQARDADEAGAVYHASLLYPSRELAPNASATYSQIAFFGPKERNVLASAAGPLSGRVKLGDVINLGFFSPVAKVLVGTLVYFQSHITFGNWGLAIIAMTLCLKLLLFPLTLKSIKTTVAMRRYKPELDEINAKFKDDAQAKQMATMELWRKHGVNPLGGCLPQLVQMPIWFAMYTTLQTAVEMYHEKFLWFKDLSAPDPFYLLPLVLGAFMILQQRIVPQQGMDPMQAKMMMYLMPLVFTVMMLFLPAALGVYMLTNSVLGIVQQLVVEKVAPRSGGNGGKGNKGEIVVKSDDASNNGRGANKAPAFGKGKARV